MKLRHIKPINHRNSFDPRDPVGSAYTFPYTGPHVMVHEADETTGAFVGVKFSNETKDGVMKFIKDNKITNPSEKDKLHCTVMYTYSDVPDLIAEERTPFDPPLIATPEKFELFKTQDDKDCLVLRIKCDRLVERHEQIIADYGAVYTHDEYKPHITLSYDCGDLDINDLDIEDLPSEIEIVEEYANSIDPNWV